MVHGRAASLLSAITLAVLVAACGSGTTTATTSSCGTPYSFQVNSRSVLSGGCAGEIGTAPHVTVSVGSRFSVQITSESSGKLLYPVPQPSGGAVRLIGHSGATAHYVAKKPGDVRLVAKHTTHCAKLAPKAGNCAALYVHVVAGSG